MAILKNISYLFSAQSINLGISFISSIYLTKILGADGRGLNALFTNALSFATLFFGFSITATIIYFINNEKIALEKLLTSLILFCLISTSLVFATLIGLNYFGLLYLALPEGFQSWKYIVLFVSLHLITLWNSILAVILNAHKTFKSQSLLSIIITFLTLLVYILAYYFWFTNQKGNEFNFVLVVTLFISSLNFLVTTLIYIKKIKIFPSRELISWDKLKLVASFSFLAYFGNLLQFFSYKLDFWFVDGYLGKTQLGVYSLATQLAQLIWILPNAIGGILYAYASSEKRENALRYTASLTTITLFVSIILACAEIFCLYFTLTLLYGKDFSLSFPIIILLMLGTIPLGPAIVLASYFASQGKYKINLYGTALGTLSCFFLYPILIKSYGLYGAAIASSLTYILNSWVLFYFAKKDGVKFLKTTLADIKSKLTPLSRKYFK